MSKTSSAGLTPETEAEVESLVLYAVIRAASKYAHQGRLEGKAVAMQVKRLENTDYAFHLDNGNRYRREDLTFYIRGLDGKLIKLR